MKDKAAKIQVVINTLQHMEIRARSETMIAMLSCIRVLEEVRDGLNTPEEQEAEEE